MWGMDELLVGTTPRGPFITIGAVTGGPLLNGRVLFEGQTPFVPPPPFFFDASYSNCCMLRS
jgi:hypothetical protein